LGISFNGSEQRAAPLGAIVDPPASRWAGPLSAGRNFYTTRRKISSMESLLQFIDMYGLWVVFFCVLLDQGGLPTPAYPPIIVTAALAVEDRNSVFDILLVATLAAIVADVLWYACGKRFGAAMLRLICKVSLSPDSCVGATRRVYGRWGARSLIFAKYVPGLAAVATTLAGETRIGVARFILYDGLGAMLWAGGAIAIGVVFHDAVDAVLMTLESLGNYALLLLAAAIGLFILSKWRQRRRFLMQIRMARVTPAELGAMIDSGARPTILDVRSAQERALSGWIPGSLHVQNVEELQLDPQAEVIVYCDCPNDASAAVFARKLHDRGFARARPLAGGLSAWQREGRTLVLS
jgi:membrane protein DedA with SNARE-associated domain/rhodanese-related sulfurtransferase